MEKRTAVGVKKQEKMKLKNDIEFRNSHERKLENNAMQIFGLDVGLVVPRDELFQANSNRRKFL